MNFVIYSTQTGQISRLIFDGTERSVRLREGEAYRELVDKDPLNLHELQALITSETGLDPEDFKQAVVVGGRVAKVITVDPIRQPRIPEGARLIPVARGTRASLLEYDAQTDSVRVKEVDSANETARVG